MGLRYRSVQQSGFFFITTSTLGLIRRFTHPIDFEMLENNIEFYRQREKAAISSYVIMPNHFHLTIFIPEKASISNFMRDLKRRTAREYFELYNMPYGRLWENRFDDLSLFTDHAYKIKLNYIHMNPVKAGLVEKPEDWIYSSTRLYMFGEKRIIKISAIEI